MANTICGGMKTLAVASEQAGKTNQILADTYASVEALKPSFTTSDPTVKTNAPATTEIIDMPIYIFHRGPKRVQAKWAVDIVTTWDGRFDETAVNVVKNLSDKLRGNSEWEL